MTLTFAIPAWIEAINRGPHLFSDLETAMDFVLEATARNIKEGGGPFGAAVLTQDLELVALGVNRVRPAQASALHAPKMCGAKRLQHC